MGVRRVVLRLPQGEHIVRALHTVPALVAIHGVVAAADGGDAADAKRRQLASHRVEGRRRALWRRVAPIQERMDVKSLGAAFRREFNHRLDLIFVTMYTARR